MNKIMNHIKKSINAPSVFLFTFMMALAYCMIKDGYWVFGTICVFIAFVWPVTRGYRHGEMK